MENYIPETTPEIDEILTEQELEELIEENNIEDSFVEEVEIQEEDILFVEDVEIVEDELVAEVIPEESEIETEPVEEEFVAEVIPEEAEIETEPVEEELVAEVIPEEDLSKIPQTLPDWSEERPIPDFGFSEENTDLETSEEFIAEMDRGIEDEPIVEITDDAEIITTEEVALIPTEPKPPVFTIIPVPVEEEILEDDSIFEEPEVIFVEEVDEEDILDVEIIPEARNIIPVEDVVEIVVEEVVKPSLSIVEKLESGKYYVQIATYSKVENVEKILSTYGNNYPIVCYQPSDRSDYQVMIGGLNKDEYAIVLERFRKAGYKDAFLRSTF